MNTKLMMALAAVSSCGLLLYAFWSAGPEQAKDPQTRAVKLAESVKPEKVADAPQMIEKAAQAPLALATAGQPLPNGPLDAAGKQRLIEAIHLTAVSYDPVDLPRIQPYLIHPDPEVREAALNGVVVLGHAAGAPLLREAAKRLGKSKEAEQLMEKADYLELPSVPLEVIKARFAKKAAQSQMPADNHTSPQSISK